MKKDKKDNIITNKEQTGKRVKSFPIKNKMTDAVKNTAQKIGLNQTKTTRDDLLPSDGDNLTQ